METAKREILRNLQLAFIGKIMAGLSHDFNNHLAIIKELEGLLADLLRSEKSDHLAHRDRYNNILSRIDDRVEQAKEVTSMLSSFAHRMDLACSSFNGHAVLAEEVFLLQRFVKQKGLNLELVPTDRPLQIYNNPSLLQFVIFGILGPAIDTLAPKGGMSLSLRPQGAALQIIIDIKGQKKESAAKDTGTIPPEILSQALSLLHAEMITSSPAEGHHQTSLTLSDLLK